MIHYNITQTPKLYQPGKNNQYGHLLKSQRSGLFKWTRSISQYPLVLFNCSFLLYILPVLRDWDKIVKQLKVSSWDDSHYCKKNIWLNLDLWVEICTVHLCQYAFFFSNVIWLKAVLWLSLLGFSLLSFLGSCCKQWSKLRILRIIRLLPDSYQCAQLKVITDTSI